MESSTDSKTSLPRSAYAVVVQCKRGVTSLGGVVKSTAPFFGNFHSGIYVWPDDLYQPAIVLFTKEQAEEIRDKYLKHGYTATAEIREVTVIEGSVEPLIKEFEERTSVPETFIQFGEWITDIWFEKLRKLVCRA